MIELDGSFGEGGGQIIRSALALSVVTGKPFTVKHIRAKRSKPGLQNQHLTAVRAAATICGAAVDDARLSCSQFTFSPGQTMAGQYHFNIGTAGSTMLVLQTVLPPLMISNSVSELTLQGGTHNTHAPPFEFLQQTFLPIIERMGPKVSIELDRYGFYPPGGGQVRVTVHPADLQKLHLGRRTKCNLSARALLVKLPKHIGERELALIKKELPSVSRSAVEHSENALSPGNVVFINARWDELTETFTQIGERGLPAETVAERACTETKAYLKVQAGVGEHLTDQLLLPMAMAGGGSFFTVQPTLHTMTNIEVIRNFLDVSVSVQEVEPGLFHVQIDS